MKINEVLYFLICILTGCYSGNNRNSITEPLIIASNQSTIIDCDSMYFNKNYQLILTSVNDSLFSRDASKFNHFFQFKNSINSIEYFSDSIYSLLGEIRFEDFNNDGVKDILIQNDSDVRSNLTYYLFLVDTLKNELTQIKGFDEIKNPTYYTKYDLVESLVMSGRDWTQFYKIQKDSVFEKGEIFYWGQDENGFPADPQKEYEKRLQTIIEK